MDAHIRRVARVEEVHDHDVVLLPVAVAASDALLDALGIPREVVVDDHRAELEVDALRPRLGGEENSRLAAEGVDEGVPHHHGTRGRILRMCRPVGRVDPLRRLVLPSAAREADDLPRVAVRLQVVLQERHRAARLREDDGLLRRAQFAETRPPLLQGREQALRLPVRANRARPRGKVCYARNLGLQTARIDRVRFRRSVFRRAQIVRHRLFVRLLLVVFGQFLHKIGILAQQVVQPRCGRRPRLGPQPPEPRKDRFQRAGQGDGRRGQDLADEQREHRALGRRKGIGCLVLKIGGHILVKRLFPIRTGEGFRQRKAFRVPDERLDVPAQGSPGEFL